MSRLFLPLALPLAILALPVHAPAQDYRGPVKVFVKDGKILSAAPELPVDPAVAVSIAHSSAFRCGVSVDGKRLTCSPNGSVWVNARVDGAEIMLGNFGMMVAKPLPPGPGGKKRNGTIEHETHGDVVFTQIAEAVPGRPMTKGPAKRRTDTAFFHYIIENKGTKEHTVELRTAIDILVNSNDGALFCAPTLYPGKVLNGVMLEGKTMPDFVQVMEMPDPKNPGFYGILTTKFGSRLEGPSRLALTNLGAFAMFEVMVGPAGDSALAMYWAPKKLAPGAKREVVWAYGGGIASSPESEGNVSLGLSGSFEPGKTFTITAQVSDPSQGQSLRLELPEGMRRLEGKEIQPVPEPGDSGSSLVVWRASVERLGSYDLKVHSSNGVTQIKSLRIVPATSAE
ncbi:MAG: hypothetical protein U0793_05460 [Gemmataceae bacterium]